MTANANNAEKTFNSRTTYPYHKGCNVDNNLKTPIVVEDNSNSSGGKIKQFVSNSNESSQDFIVDSMSEVNLSQLGM